LDKIKKKIKNNFGKAVLIIAGGTFLAQLINIVVSPIITRIYTPEEYGILTFYTAALALLAIGSFKYELAIPITKEDKTAINVLALSVLVLCLFVIIIFVSLLFFGDFILGIFNYEVLSDFIYLIPLGVFLLGLYQIFRQWIFRKKDYKSLSKTTINQSVFGNSFKVITGLFGFGPTGLIIGQIIGQSAGLTRLTKPIFQIEKNILKNITLKNMIWCAKRYKDFPIFNTSIHFLSTLGKQLPIIFIASFFGSHVVGLYGLAYSIVRLPMTLIGSAVGDVFFAEAASLGKENPKKIKQISNKLIKNLALVGIIPVVVLLLFGPQLFSIVFGEAWYEAGVYARIVSIMLFFILIFSPVSRVYEIFEKQKLRLVIDIIRVVLISIVFAFSWFFDFNSYIAILLYSIVISIIHLIIFIFAQKILNDEIV